MYQILKELALPPSDLLLILAAGLVLLALGRRKAGGALMALGTVALYVLSMPYVAGGLGTFVQTVPALSEDRLLAEDPQAIVVLAGGMSPYRPEFGGETVDHVTLERLHYAAHLQRKTGLPVLVSGGLLSGTRTPAARAMQMALEQDFGVAVAWVEDYSRNTFENARLSAHVLEPGGVRTILLVTHAVHMPRAAEAFRANGFQVTPAPTGFIAPSRTFPTDYLPHMTGLQHSTYALYEMFAQLWYAVRY